MKVCVVLLISLVVLYSSIAWGLPRIAVKDATTLTTGKYDEADDDTLPYDDVPLRELAGAYTDGGSEEEREFKLRLPVSSKHSLISFPSVTRYQESDPRVDSLALTFVHNYNAIRTELDLVDRANVAETAALLDGRMPLNARRDFTVVVVPMDTSLWEEPISRMNKAMTLPIGAYSSIGWERPSTDRIPLSDVFASYERSEAFPLQFATVCVSGSQLKVHTLIEYDDQAPYVAKFGVTVFAILIPAVHFEGYRMNIYSTGMSLLERSSAISALPTGGTMLVPIGTFYHTIFEALIKHVILFGLGEFTHMLEDGASDLACLPSPVVMSLGSLKAGVPKAIIAQSPGSFVPLTDRDGPDDRVYLGDTRVVADAKSFEDVAGAILSAPAIRFSTSPWMKVEHEAVLPIVRTLIHMEKLHRYRKLTYAHGISERTVTSDMRVEPTESTVRAADFNLIFDS